MNHFKQLTYEERYIIYSLLKENFTISAMSRNIKRSKSTISREIQRNSGLRSYRPKQANEKAMQRRLTSHKTIKFTQKLQSLVEDYLHLDWSPEQVSNYLKLEYSINISIERIYQHIASNKAFGGTLYKHLRQSSRKRRKRYTGNKDTRGELRNRTSIDNRPTIVDKKKRIGDWEIDTVIGKNHKGALVTIVERKSRFTVMDHIPSRHSENVRESVKRMLKPIKSTVLTVTCDNGKEFACHEKLSKDLDADFYFAHPYCSWERGLNENTNGLIRQYFPKGSSFKNINKKDLVFTMNRLNNRPRKCLNYKTPMQIIEKLFTPRGE